MAQSPAKKTLPAKKETSKQYDLFTSFFGDAKNLSNTIELWDAIPKYAVSASKQVLLRDSKGSLPVYEQKFQYRPTAPNLPEEINCKMSIQPAAVKNSDGSYTQYYPSADEEIIEEVLKKIFTDQQFGTHDPQKTESWIKFTLYMVQKELKGRGKTRSIDEIKSSLEILSSSVIKVEFEGQNKKMAYTNPILNDMIGITRTDYLEDPKSVWKARLPGLISKSINETTYRQMNYAIHMNLKNHLARWFHTRLSHQYTQAHMLSPYSILFSTIKRDSGRLHHSRNAANIKTVDDALNELKANNVLLQFEKEVRRKGRKIEDIKYTLTPSPEFSQEMKRANARQRDHMEELEGRPQKPRMLRR